MIVPLLKHLSGFHNYGLLDPKYETILSLFGLSAYILF